MYLKLFIDTFACACFPPSLLVVVCCCSNRLSVYVSEEVVSDFVLFFLNVLRK